MSSTDSAEVEDVATSQASVQLQYMWADAGIPLHGFQRLAQSNPLRWSRRMGPAEFVAELESQTEQDRPVKMVARTSEEYLERDFESTGALTQWVQARFACQSGTADGASRRGQWRLAPFLGDCACVPAVQADAHELQVGTSSPEEAERSPETNAGTGAESSTPASSPQSAVQPAFEEASSSLEFQIPQQQEHVSLRYMWDDSRLLPLPGMRELAQRNPLRWSLWQSPASLASALEAEGAKARPLILSADLPGQAFQRTFPSPAAAARWIRTTFNAEGKREEKEEEEERLCVICLSAPREILLMPCRHAVLCEACMQTLMASNESNCPICRTRINNHARGFFVNDYVELVEAMETRMEQSRSATYTGMYNHVRPLMVTGALLASGAAVCFVVAPAAVPALLGGAVAVGYVPWFATTVAHFEREDLQNDEVGAPGFFSREDLGRPLTLLAKLAMMTIAAPVAATVFFVPYGLYAGVVRPLSRHMLHGLIRAACAAYVYGARPAGRLLVSAARAFENCLVAGARSLGDSIAVTALAIHEYMLSPAWAAAGHVAAAVRSASSAVAHAVASVARGTYDHILLPSANLTMSALRMLGNAIRAAATAVHEQILLPGGRAAWSGLQVAGNALGTAATTFYAYVLLPGGEAAWGALRALGRASGAIVVGAHDWILVPAGRAGWAALVKLGDGMAAAATGLYGYVLVPAARAAGWVASCVAHGAAAGARLAFDYVVVPSGQAAWAALAMLGGAITTSAEAVYRNVLLPSARFVSMVVGGVAHGIVTAASGVAYGIATAAGGVAYGIATAAAATYGYVLVPVGSALAHGIVTAVGGVAYGISTAAAATYGYVLVPAGSAVAAGATLLYVYAVVPGGRALKAVGSATLHAAGSVLECGRAGASAAYVYVILPGGQVLRLAVDAVGHGARACGEQASLAVGSACSSIRLAGRQSMESLRRSNFA